MGRQGLEPWTDGLKIRSSNRLSYRPDSRRCGAASLARMAPSGQHLLRPVLAGHLPATGGGPELEARVRRPPSETVTHAWPNQRGCPPPSSSSIHGVAAIIKPPRDPANTAEINLRSINAGVALPSRVSSRPESRSSVQRRTRAACIGSSGR